MRHHSPRSGLFRRWLTATTALASVLPVLALTVPAAHANPEGGSVVQGAATITQTSPKTVTVNQTTDKAVINWQSFSIGAGETTRFNQPSSSSTTLNRVTGDQVSQILGNLSANGKVFLVNPNGIVFGAGSKIDVAALVASTADIKTDNFMAGNLRFDIPGKVGAEIINQGTITAADGGLVALVSPVLRNSGIIQARLGKVALASANGMTLDLYGDNLILFQAADKITQQMVDTDGKPVTTAIDNSGQIYADGGRVLMTANTAKGVVDNAINTTGLVSARAVEQHGGEIVLKGEEGGIVQVASSLDVSGAASEQIGGLVQVTGEKIGLFYGTKINASGNAGGGTVIVGGDYLGGTASDETLAQLGIHREGQEVATAAYTNMADGAQIAADALSSGNGGKVVLWSDNRTIAYGTITAKGGAHGGDGGFIEVSGKKQLEIASLTTDASASAGKAGTVLYDPGNVYITSDAEAVASYDVTNFTSTTPWDGRTNIAASNIEAVLNNGTNVVIRATPEGPDVDSWGDVYVQHSINKTRGGEAMLSLFSADEIHVASGVSIASTSGKLNLYFDADYDRHSYGGIFLDSGSAIRTNGGFVNLNGSDIYRNGVIDTSVTHPDSSGDTRSGEIRKAHDYFTRVDFSFLAPPPNQGFNLTPELVQKIQDLQFDPRYQHAVGPEGMDLSHLSDSDVKTLQSTLAGLGIVGAAYLNEEIDSNYKQIIDGINDEFDPKIKEAIDHTFDVATMNRYEIANVFFSITFAEAMAVADVTTGGSIHALKGINKAAENADNLRDAMKIISNYSKSANLGAHSLGVPKDVAVAIQGFSDIINSPAVDILLKTAKVGLDGAVSFNKEAFASAANQDASIKKILLDAGFSAMDIAAGNIDGGRAFNALIIKPSVSAIPKIAIMMSSDDPDVRAAIGTVKDILTESIPVIGGVFEVAHKISNISEGISKRTDDAAAVVEALGNAKIQLIDSVLMEKRRVKIQALFDQANSTQQRNVTGI